MGIFRKKPVEIEAIMWTGENEEVIQDMTGPENFYALSPEDRENCEDPEATATVYDKIHSTWILVLPENWIIKGVNGEFYPCSNDVFERTYEAVS